ncbi:retrovirus-related pol polyprotein from transposon TNT 1-94 [Tanacetum coccineum]
MPALKDYNIFDFTRDDEDDGVVADMNNLDTTIKKELLQFKLQEVWTLVDLPNGKRAIGTKWVFRNKKDERGIVIRNKARLAILTYASFKDDVAYQMDVKSAFLYGKIEEEVYVCQPPGFEDPNFPDRVYKVEKTLLDNEFQRGKLTKPYSSKGTKQKKDGIFISQDKYVGEILKKFGFIEVKTTSTPMETQKPLLKNEDGEEVDVHMYRSMIGSLMYLTSSRPGSMYLKGQQKLGFWYPKDSPCDLVAYIDSDYAGASLYRKSTTGEAEHVAASSCCGQVLWIQNQLLDYGSRRSKRKDTEVPRSSGPITNVADETVNEEMDDRTSSGSGPRRQETIGDTIAQTRSENVSKLSNDPLLARVIDLEKTKASQAQEITSLKRRVKRLEKKGGSRTHGLKRLYKVGLSRRVKSSDEKGLGKEDASKQGRIADIGTDAGINLASTHFDADTYMFGVHDLVGDEVVVESEVAVKAASTIPVSVAITTTTVITDDEITLAKALVELKSAKLPTTAATTVTTASTRPKAKGIVIHEEEKTTTPIKDQLMLDEELAFKLQAEEEEEYRLVRQREEEANIVSWDNVSKRAGEDLQQESIKKQKVDEDNETTELQRLIKVILDKEEVGIDVIPLATKPPSIVEYKIHKEGKKTYYQIIKANGSSKMYLVFSHMLKNFDREDLETLYKLVKAKHGSTRPEEGYERMIWGDLKIIFDPHVGLENI